MFTTGTTSSMTCGTPFLVFAGSEWLAPGCVLQASVGPLERFLADLAYPPAASLLDSGCLAPFSVLTPFGGLRIPPSTTCQCWHSRQQPQPATQEQEPVSLTSQMLQCDKDVVWYRPYVGKSGRYS